MTGLGGLELRAENGQINLRVVHVPCPFDAGNGMNGGPRWFAGRFAETAHGPFDSADRKATIGAAVRGDAIWVFRSQVRTSAKCLLEFRL